MNNIVMFHIHDIGKHSLLRIKTVCMDGLKSYGSPFGSSIGLDDWTDQVTKFLELIHFKIGQILWNGTCSELSSGVDHSQAYDGWLWISRVSSIGWKLSIMVMYAMSVLPITISIRTSSMDSSSSLLLSSFEIFLSLLEPSSLLNSIFRSPTSTQVREWINRWELKSLNATIDVFLPWGFPTAFSRFEFELVREIWSNMAGATGWVGDSQADTATLNSMWNPTSLTH